MRSPASRDISTSYHVLFLSRHDTILFLPDSIIASHQASYH